MTAARILDDKGATVFTLAPSQTLQEAAVALTQHRVGWTRQGRAGLGGWKRLRSLKPNLSEMTFCKLQSSSLLSSARLCWVILKIFNI